MRGLEGAVDGLELARGEARQQRRLQRRHARQHVLAPARPGSGLRLLMRRLRRRLRRRRRISHDGEGEERWDRFATDSFRLLLLRQGDDRSLEDGRLRLIHSQRILGLGGSSQTRLKEGPNLLRPWGTESLK